MSDNDSLPRAGNTTPSKVYSLKQISDRLGSVATEQASSRRRQTSRPRYPQGPWPEEMAADMAAAFVDEVSVAAFLAKVGTIWPLSVRGRGSRQKWSRELLIRAVRERHKIVTDDQVEDVAALI